jgi:hypothetical protein
VLAISVRSAWTAAMAALPLVAAVAVAMALLPAATVAAAMVEATLLSLPTVAMVLAHMLATVRPPAMARPLLVLLPPTATAGLAGTLATAWPLLALTTARGKWARAADIIDKNKDSGGDGFGDEGMGTLWGGWVGREGTSVGRVT